ASLPALTYSDGSAAAGITLSLGQETAADSNVVDFSATVGSFGLAGTGGGNASYQNLLHAGSIYGAANDADNSTPGKDGIFGNAGTGVVAGAIGLRLDGLAAGDYLVYVMARNTNANSTGNAMNIFAGTGASSGIFDFGAQVPHSQTNAL